ncbi:MAG: GNAT family N-acetyltransferase [Deltaproteobacteria bacterium]|nr:MAG: GNAT family N-acetyltransferase [Deltaproteobacteria bacterium]
MRPDRADPGRHARAAASCAQRCSRKLQCLVRAVRRGGRRRRTGRRNLAANGSTQVREGPRALTQEGLAAEDGRALKVHFIGIAGTGMGALAGLMREAGHDVRGSDAAIYPPMSTQLEEAGIDVFEGFDPANLAWGPDRVVVGNVCSADHPEVVAAKERGIALESFPSMLASALLEGRDPYVVVGTHGKTTTASALAWCLVVAGADPSYLIGGVPQNLGRGYHLGSGDTFVVEGDEYDTAFFDKRSKFLHYRPKRAILTSVEFDHADIFADLDEVRRTFRAFAALIPADGDLLVCGDDPEALGCAAACEGRIHTYGVVPDEASVGERDYAAVVRSRPGARRTVFDVYERGTPLGTFSTQLVGQHNVANLLAVIGLCRLHGCDPEVVARGIQTFRGVRRRQELLGVAQGVRVIDDFAHHPTAVAMTVSALRRRYPEHALHVCFEPRSASSRRRVFQQAYASAFDAASSVRIGPLYRPEKVPANERLDPVELARAIGARGVPARAFERTDVLLEDVISAVAPGDTVLVLSSGSFDDLGTRILQRLGDPVVFAQTRDRPQVDALLAGYGLPAVVWEPTVDTLVIRGGEDVVACVSLDVRGDAAFLFGLAVTPERRGEGLGWVLGDCIMRHARTQGVRRIYLVTATASNFFATKLGFTEVPREVVDPRVVGSPNFEATAALEGAVCMVFELPTEGAILPPRT